MRVQIFRKSNIQFFNNLNLSLNSSFNIQSLAKVEFFMKASIAIAIEFEVLFFIYINHYFISISLFQLLRERYIEICEIIRVKDLFSILQKMKRDYFKSLEWETICAKIFDNVFTLIWQNNNLVLTLFTIHSLKNKAISNWKWVLQIFTNEELIRKMFEIEVKKNLNIFIFIDDYNYNMREVNLVNQYKTKYETHRFTRRNWFSILYWILDVFIVNVYRI